LENGRAATTADFVFSTCFSPLFLAMDAQPLLYVGCEDGTINVYRHSRPDKWTLVRSLQPRDRFIGGPIAVDPDGVLFAVVGELQDKIDVFAPGAYGSAAPVHQIPNFGPVAMAVDSLGVLYASTANVTYSLVFLHPESEDHYDLEVMPTRFEEEYYGALTVDEQGRFWTRFEHGNEYSKWTAADFVQRDRLDPRQDRHFETRDCWGAGDSPGGWEEAGIFSMLVVGNYLYYTCIYGAYQWQDAVFVYDIRNPGHEVAVESIAPPTVGSPFGLAVGP